MAKLLQKSLHKQLDLSPKIPKTIHIRYNKQLNNLASSSPKNKKSILINIIKIIKTMATKYNRR